MIDFHANFELYDDEQLIMAYQFKDMMSPEIIKKIEQEIKVRNLLNTFNKRYNDNYKS